MSDTVYSFHDDEGYAEDSIYHQGHVVTPLLTADKELFYSEYSARHEPRFTEEEMYTVIQGTRAEYRISLKEDKRRNNQELQRLHNSLEQTLAEEKMIAENSIAERISLLAMAREETDLGDTTDEHKIASEQELEFISQQIEDLGKRIENIKIYRDLTDDNVMEIKEQLDELDISCSRTREMRSSMLEDFIETDSTYKKTVRKCRESKSTLISSVEQVDRLVNQIERKQQKVREAEMRFLDYLTMAREEMQQKNKQYEDLTKNCKQEILITNTQLKRKKMELQEWDSQISKEDKRNMELKKIGDELMAAMQ